MVFMPTCRRANTGYALYANSAATGTGYGIYSNMSAANTGFAIYANTPATGTAYRHAHSQITGHGNTGYAGYFTNTDTGSGANVNYGLYVNNSNATGYAIYAVGNITATTLTLTSDARAKKDIVTIEPGDALEKLAKMRPVSFNWIKGGKADMGFIAQEIEPDLPDGRGP